MIKVEGPSKTTKNDVTKVCNRCKTEQPIGQFTKDSSLKGGRKNQCKECINKSNRAKTSGHRTTHTGLTPPKQLRAVANRNAMIILVKRHMAEFDQLVEFEHKRLKKLDQDPDTDKKWLEAGLF